MTPLPHPQTGLERRKAKGEQGVFEDLEVALDRGARDAAVPRDAGNVHHLPVEERRDGEEPDEPREVAHERLGLDLLAHVELDVALEHGPPIVGRHDQGQRTETQGAPDIEVPAHLVRRERVHRLAQGSPGEQVRAGRAELPCAGAEKGEADLPGLDEPVHLVEERRHALDLVEDHERPRRRLPELEGQQAGVGQELLVPPLLEQVDVVRAGDLPSRPGALARAPDAEQEEAPVRDSRQPRVIPVAHIVVIMPCKMTAYLARLPPVGRSLAPGRLAGRQSAASTSSMICFEPTTPSPCSSYSTAK